MRKPWMKFYPSDWRSDPKLRMCGLAARGLWIEMIGLMHEAQPYGHLLVAGERPTDTQLAVLVGTATDQIPGLIGELESADVFSRNQEGVIYSRRLTRDEKRAKEGRKSIKRRWEQNAEIKQQNSSPNRRPNSPPSTQRPEARSQSNSAPNGAAENYRHVIDYKLILFNESLDWLADVYDVKPNSLRSLFGKWLQSCHDDPEKLVGLIADCQRENRADPKAWITACLKESKDETTRSGARPSKAERAKAAVKRAAVAGGYAGEESESETGASDDAVSVLSGSEAVRQGTGDA